MNKQALNRIIEKPRWFITSPWFTVLLIAISSVSMFTGFEFTGVVVLSIMLTLTLAVSDDLLPAFETLLAICCFAIRLRKTYMNFFNLWPLALPIIALLLIHICCYKIKLSKVSFTSGMIATSVALMLGGIGFISYAEYTAMESVYHIFMLGFGTMLFAMYFAGSLERERKYNLQDKFAEIMVMVIVIICIAIAEEYISRWGEFTSKMSVLPFQWRNNASTLLMLSMPFGFYFAKKRFRYSLIALLAYIGIVFTGSRGGLLFGSVELGLCVITMLIVDKRHRKIYAIGVALLAVTVAILSRYMFELISYTIQRFMDPGENSIRLELIDRGISDFRNNLIFGTGMGYMGNRDVHPSVQLALCWYHCSLVQVPASMGIVGIIAYIWLNIQRVKLFIKKISFFGIIMMLSFIGLEMMSLVNPGIFCPLPYLIIVTFYFVIMDKTDLGGKEELKKIMKGEKQ